MVLLVCWCVSLFVCFVSLKISTITKHGLPPDIYGSQRMNPTNLSDPSDFSSTTMFTFVVLSEMSQQLRWIAVNFCTQLDVPSEIIFN